MIRHADLLCRDDTRRRRIIASPTLQGIDYLEVVTEIGRASCRERV